MVEISAEPGDTVSVDFEVINSGGIPDEQDILLTLENGDKVTLDEVPGLELEVDETGDGQLVWEISEDIEEQVYDLCVESDNTSDCIFDPLGEFNELEIEGFDVVYNESISSDNRSLFKSGSRIYVGSTNEVLGAYNSSDGSEIWENELHTDEIRGIWSDGDIVTSGDWDGNIISTNADDGSENWTYTRSSERWFGTLSDGSSVYAGGFNDGSLVSLDVNDGSEQWLVDDLTDSAEDVLMYNGNPLFGTEDGVFHLDADDGSVIDTYDVDTDGTSMSLNGDLLSATDSTNTSGKVTHYDLDNDEELWTSFEGETRPRDVYLSDDITYITIGSNDYGEILAHDNSDGSLVWEARDLDTSNIYGISIEGDDIYYSGENDLVKGKLV